MTTPLSTQSNRFGHMSECSFVLLRHLQAKGPCTNGDLIKIESATPKAAIEKSVQNLQRTGYIERDARSKDPRYTVTSKGLAKLADPHDTQVGPALRMKERIRAQLAPISEPAAPALPPAVVPASIKKVKKNEPGFALPRQQDSRGTRYVPTEYAASIRPGAMKAFTYPSRVGNRLHHPDGRVTDMAGIHIKTIQA